MAIVGQELASELLWNKLIAFFTDEKRGKPLVLLLAGPPGHGKTFLANNLRAITSHPFLKIACEQDGQSAMTLFGAPAPYVGSEKGSALNNFLSEQSGKPCLVLMDEFEKMVCLSFFFFFFFFSFLASR